MKVLRAWYDPAVSGFYINGEGMKHLQESVLKRLIPLYELTEVPMNHNTNPEKVIQ